MKLQKMNCIQLLEILYNATGDFPVPFDGGYTNVTVGGNATCAGDLNISGNFINTGTFKAQIMITLLLTDHLCKQFLVQVHVTLKI